MTRSQSKKSKIENNSHSLEISKEKNLDVVPLDVAIEIFLRLPSKSIAKCLLLSKFWAEVIRSRHFITSFQVRSSLLQPRLLVVFIDTDSERNCEDWYFFSLSSSSKMTYLSRVTCPFSPDYVYCPHYVNGLISLGYGLNKCIANPSTGTCKVLRRVETSSTVAQSFFGYDPVNDEYKLLVLCMVEKTQRFGGRTRILQVSSQHQVATLGAKQQPWRMIDYKTPHRPVFNSVCIDGVLYYVAFTGDDLSQLSLMRFDLRSEKLDLFTSLPADFRVEFLHGSTTLVSYKGKVALATSTNNFEVWVLDQHAETHRWLRKSFSLSLKHRNKGSLFIRGITHTGEFIFAPRFFSYSFDVVYYNPDTNIYRKIKVKLHADSVFKRRGIGKTKVMVFSDYVESVRLL